MGQERCLVRPGPAGNGGAPADSQRPSRALFVYPKGKPMTTTFTASNGITITSDEPYNIRWKSDYGSGALDYPINSGADDALAEWYQHRRDEKLGRWRDTVNQNLVVYPNGDDVV